MTEEEAEEDKLFWETYESLTKYLAEKTNCSVVRCESAEGDDVIARWIALHPQDEHIIISSDTDFVQLLAPNVKQYNGISDELHTIEGIFDAKGKPVIDKKSKQPKQIPDPEWLLFEKCMRGDSSDNVFSAFPGVRTKGTKNKVGLQEAFEDRKKQGFNWNNLMLQRWNDPDGVEHRVLDDYQRNVTLVDLTAQPQEVKDTVDRCIREQISHKDVGQVGSHFLKFCGKFELVKCSESSESFGRWLNETYKGVLNK
jgi:5'-3' exonuclease